MSNLASRGAPAEKHPREIIDDLLEFAVKFAEMNDEPAEGSCWDAIDAARGYLAAAHANAVDARHTSAIQPFSRDEMFTLEYLCANSKECTPQMEELQAKIQGLLRMTSVGSDAEGLPGSAALCQRTPGETPRSLGSCYSALDRALEFVEGFEDDESQEGVGEILGDGRAALAALSELAAATDEALCALKNAPQVGGIYDQQHAHGQTQAFLRLKAARESTATKGDIA